MYTGKKGNTAIRKHADQKGRSAHPIFLSSRTILSVYIFSYSVIAICLLAFTLIYLTEG